jgi:hypothetical protein
MIRTLCFTLILATASAATIAVATYSSPAPAATPSAAKEQQTKEQLPPGNEGVRPARAVDSCRFVVWPQIPAECIRNDNEGRARRAVRVIPIHSAGAN